MARTSGAAAGQKQIVRDDLICSLCPESATSCFCTEQEIGRRVCEGGKKKKEKVCRGPEIEPSCSGPCRDLKAVLGFHVIIHTCIIFNGGGGKQFKTLQGDGHIAFECSW